MKIKSVLNEVLNDELPDDESQDGGFEAEYPLDGGPVEPMDEPDEPEINQPVDMPSDTIIEPHTKKMKGIPPINPYTELPLSKRKAPERNPQPKPIIGSSFAATEEVIKKIIDNYYRVEILYQGEEESTPSWRMVDIYVLGHTKGKNNRVIRAYHTTGKSVSKERFKEKNQKRREKGEAPFINGQKDNWRLYLLDNITEIKLTGYHYGYTEQKGYNHYGDKKMQGPIKNKKFGDYE